MTDKKDEAEVELMLADIKRHVEAVQVGSIPEVYPVIEVYAEKYFATVRQQGIEEGERRERERVMTKFCNYVKSNWYASLGYGEKKDMEIFESAIEEFSWLEIDKQQILQTLTNDRY